MDVTKTSCEQKIKVPPTPPHPIAPSDDFSNGPVPSRPLPFKHPARMWSAVHFRSKHAVDSLSVNVFRFVLKKHSLSLRKKDKKRPRY